MTLDVKRNLQNKKGTTNAETRRNQRKHRIREGHTWTTQKRDKGNMSSNDWEELRKREKTLDEFTKSLRGRELSQRRQQNHRDGRKRKIDGLDENTKKLVTGKSIATPGAPTKVDNFALIETICRIAISAADDRRRSEVIRTVKSLDDLTTSLRSEGFELSR